MSRTVKLDIIQNPEELKKLLSEQKTATGKERVQALYLLCVGEVETVQHLAVILGRDRRTVQRWLREYREGGLDKLLTVRKSPGRTSSIPQEALEKLRLELQEPEGFSSYGEVQKWLRSILGIEASYKVVHSTVRYRLKSKLKVPRPYSEQQPIGAIEAFKKNCRFS